MTSISHALNALTLLIERTPREILPAQVGSAEARERLDHILDLWNAFGDVVELLADDLNTSLTPAANIIAQDAMFEIGSEFTEKVVTPLREAIRLQAEPRFRDDFREHRLTARELGVGRAA